MRRVLGLSLLVALALLQPALTAQQDGGVTEVLQSIHIPPLLNAPFSATVHTEWTRPLPGGGSYTLVNHRQVARDSQGRIYEERWFLVPKDGKQETQMYLIQIADPHAHTLYNCFLLREPHRCILERFSEMAMSDFKPNVRPSGPLGGDAGYTTHEDLGIRTIQGIDTTGARDSITYNTGAIGNDRPFVVMREYWTAPQLGVNLLSELNDPKLGHQTFTLTDVTQSEPDPQLFELPAGFEVVDHREPPAPPHEVPPS